MQRGREVHGELSSADASTAAAIVLYDMNGVVTLGSTQIFVVTDVLIVAGVALTVTLFSDKDADAAVDGGERIVQGNFAANGGVSQHLGTHHYCHQGKTPKIKTSGAGQVDCIVHGYILNA